MMNERTENAIDRRRFLGLAATAGATLLAGGVLGGCSSAEPEPRSTAFEEPAATPEPATTPEAAEGSASSGAASKALVAVFSWSGHTLQAADRVHELVESDYFRIEPAEPYTTDYNEVLDVAQREQDDDSRLALAATVGNWDEYDTIYLGFPVWWYHVPQIVKTFADEHDLTGKTVAVFATSGGSSVAGAVSDLEALCPGARFTESITLDGDAVASQLDRVDAWLGGLGLQ